MRRVIVVFAMASAVAAACAVGVASNNGGVDAGGDSTISGDGSSCPQYDLTSDPKHCGTCTHACASAEVCSMGMCKAQCDPPTTKCASGDAGSICATLTSDPNHCGQCPTVCTISDAGPDAAGTNNPDSGIPPGYDSGTGWTYGTPACDASNCEVECPPGMTNCDGVCFDEQNFHDHCGACTNACQPTEWCNHGNCCAQGLEYCGGSCVPVLTDNNNCGTCGNVCSGTTPYCSSGVCVKGCTPTGSRQAFNTLSSHTASGCWQGNPCAVDTFSWSSTNGENFQATSQNIVCGGTTACVGHVGIATYSASTVCQGTWDVYCDSTKVGSIDTSGKACASTAMTNGCNTSFTPTSCSSIELVATGGPGVLSCCAGSAPDSMITAVSAW